MDRYQRLKRILYELEKNKKLEVEDVMTMLSVSPATVRRDFNYLVDNYTINKTWGGIALSPANDNIVDTMIPLQERKGINREAKKAIAERAAALIKDGDTVFIDGGTTTLEMVPHLADKKIKIITNSILIAQQLDSTNTKVILEVILTGGILYPQSGLLVGPHSVDFIRSFNANWAFLSAGGISESEATNSNILVVETEKAMINQSEKVVILADSNKIGKKDLVRICDLDEVDFLITERNEDKKQIPLLGKKMKQIEV